MGDCGLNDNGVAIRAANVGTPDMPAGEYVRLGPATEQFEFQTAGCPVSRLSGSIAAALIAGIVLAATISAGAQTPSAATSSPVIVGVEPGAAVVEQADQTTVKSLREQLARQRQRIHELEQVVAAPEEQTAGAVAGPYDRAVVKILKMLPTSRTMWFWFIVGMGGEFIFFLRFVVQWIASERAKRTVVPMAFWHLSLIGTGMVLAYALYKIDPVFILAYGLNIFLYVRNLVIAKRQPAMATLMEKESE